MSLVKKDEMTTLRAASAAKATAESAEDDVQLAAVAYAINQASNTGSYQIMFQEKLRDAVKEKLESEGYTIKYVNNNAYDMQKHALIIWRDATDADKLPEPSNSGPKYNTKVEPEEIQGDKGSQSDDDVDEVSTEVTDLDGADDDV